MRLITVALLFMCIFVDAVPAQDEEVVPIEIFTSSTMVEPVIPTYPRAPLSRYQEGWVILNFMVDVDGLPFEPMVVESMGSKEFEHAAIKALEQTKFNPAMVAGEPVTSSKLQRYTFQIEKSLHSASEKFVNWYRRFLRRIKKDDQARSLDDLKYLQKMGANSLYEEAYLNLAGYYYAVKYEDVYTQMQYLRKALYFDDRETYETFLPKEDAMQLWPILYALQVKNNRYAEALDTYELIKITGNLEAADTLAASANAIQELRDNDTPYAISAKTDEQGSWGVYLLKDEFYLENIQSNIDEIKLRCDQAFVFFKHEVDIKYRIHEKYGSCHLEVIGDANTSFDLVQL